MYTKRDFAKALKEKVKNKEDFDEIADDLIAGKEEINLDY